MRRATIVGGRGLARLDRVDARPNGPVAADGESEVVVMASRREPAGHGSEFVHLSVSGKF